MWLLLVVVACQKAPPSTWSSGDAPRLAAVGVAPVVRVQDVAAPPLPASAAPGAIEARLEQDSLPAPTVFDPVRDAAFLRNEYVGNVRFGGGFVRTGDVQLEVRARLIELNDQERYDDLGRRWLAEVVDDLLARRRIDGRSAPLDAAPPLDRVPVRGVHPDDGRDDVNLPRTALVARDAGGPLEAAGADYLLVPYLRSYYSHNGGWFLGQEYGCLAGARVEAWLVLYEARTGRVAWSLGAVGRHLDERQGQPSRAESDQHLLWAEDQVEEALRKGFLR